MPRKNPLPPEQAALCARLRQLRLFTGLTQAQFAAQVALDWRLWASYEYARSQLNYRAAFLLLRRFRWLNPFWLREGPPHPMLACHAIHYPPPEALNCPKNALFTDVFDLDLRQRLLASVSFWAIPGRADPVFRLPQDALGRLEAVQVFAAFLARWLAALPDDQFNLFLDALFKAAADLLQTTFKPEFGRAQEARFHSLVLADAAAAVALAPAVTPRPAEKKAQEPLDTISVPWYSPDMQQVLRSLPDLIRRVSELSAPRRTKSNLARRLGVSRQALDQWLSGKTHPSAVMVFELLRWVGEQSGTSTKPNAPAGASNTGKGPAQQKQSHERTHSPGRPKT